MMALATALLVVCGCVLNSYGQLQKPFEHPSGVPGRTTEDIQCPDPNDILPCSCWLGDGYPNLGCFAVFSNEQLARVFQADFPTKTFDQLIIEDSENVTEIGAIFNGVSFQRITLSLDNISLVTEDALADSENTLTEMFIEQGTLDSETFLLPLENFTALRRLNLKDQKFRALSNFSSKSLEKIEFPMSEITTLTPGTFKELAAIKNIQLGYNSLTRLLPGWFPLPNSNISIGLIWNNINHLESEVFVLPEYTENLHVIISLQNNNLTSVAKYAFQDVFPYVVYISLEDNPLDCGCDMSWIMENDDYRGKISGQTTCANGTQFHDLDPVWYLQNCSK